MTPFILIAFAFLAITLSVLGAVAGRQQARARMLAFEAERVARQRQAEYERQALMMLTEAGYIMTEGHPTGPVVDVDGGEKADVPRIGQGDSRG